MHRLLTACAVTASALAACVTTSAHAQTFPSRTITLVVPLAAGSTTDVAARLLSERAGKTLGEQIVIENKPGAGIMVGSAYVAKAAPDGYTMLMGTVGLSVDPLLKKVPFDAGKDFIPVAMLVNTPMVMLVAPKLGVKSLKEYMTKYKDSQDLTFSSGGSGTLPHLTGEIFAYKSKIPLRHIPYRGGANALNDVIAGHVGMFFGTPVTKPNIEHGDVLALAVAAPKRIDALPDVPTFRELGVDMSEVEAGAWFGLFVPAGTPKPIVDKLHAAYADALKDPDVLSKLELQGLIASPMSQAEFAKFFREDVARWPEIFKAANIKAAE